MNKRYFQWITGENIGKVVEFTNIEEEDNLIFFQFNDGTRCNVDLIADIKEKNPSGKYMAEVSGPDNIWKFEEKLIGGQEERWEQDQNGVLQCVVPYIEPKKISVPIPPKPSLDRFGINNSTNVTETDNSSVNYYDTRTEEERNISKSILTITTSASTLDYKTSNYENDPVIILAKNAKKHDVNIDMQLKISLPSKSLFNMIQTDFENGTDTFINYMIDSIDINTIKDALKESLLNAYLNNEE